MQSVTLAMTLAERRTVRRKLDRSPTKIPELRGDGGVVMPALRRVAAAMAGSAASRGDGSACGVAVAMADNTTSRGATTTLLRRCPAPQHVAALLRRCNDDAWQRNRSRRCYDIA
jgi:hypothetical protein